MNKEIQSYIENLKQANRRLIEKAHYMNQHKFHKEEEHIRMKIRVVEEVLFGLELVAEGAKKGNEVKINLNEI